MNKKISTYLANLEFEIEKLKNILHDNKYKKPDSFLSHKECVHFQKDYEVTNLQVEEEFAPKFGRKIEQEILQQLKRKYPQKIQSVNKKSKSEQPKVIIFTGPIAVGKTTCSDKLAEYLRSQKFTVLQYVEASLEIERELKLFYKDVEKHALFFQYVILDYYKKKVKEINGLTGYDYIILECTYFNTEIFTLANITDSDIVEYFKEECDNIPSIKNIEKIFYLNCDEKTMLEQQKICNPGRIYEKVDSEYLYKIRDFYEQHIDRLYPDHIKISTDCDKNEYINILKSYFN